MGASKSKTKTDVDMGPYGPAQPQLNDVALPGILTDYNAMKGWKPYGDYTGSGVADFTDAQRQAMDAIKGIATSGGGVTGNAVDWAKGVLSPDFLSGKNPVWSGLSAAIADPIQARTSAQFGMAGRGNAGGEAGDTGLAGTMARNITTGLSPAAKQFLGIQQNVAGMAPTLDAARYADAEKLFGVGGVQQEMNQAQLGDKIYQAMYRQQQPSAALDAYLQRLRGIASLGQKGTTTSETTQTPSWGQTLAGGVGLGLGAISAWNNPASFAAGFGQRFRLPWM